MIKKGAGVHGDFHGLFRVVGIVPVTVFLELVTEYAVDEVLDTRICPAPVAFRDDVFHCPEADLLDSGKRPEDFIGGIVGEELRPGAVEAVVDGEVVTGIAQVEGIEAGLSLFEEIGRASCRERV